jgi:hypothetical protein
MYEKFIVHTSPEAVIADMPTGLTGEQRQRRMILKSIPPPYVSYRH